MPAITLANTDKNRKLMAIVADRNGAELDIQPDTITVRSNNRITVDREWFDFAYMPNTTVQDAERIWGMLLMVRDGEVLLASSTRYILDNPTLNPTKRPLFHFRFDSDDAKVKAEMWSKYLGHNSLTRYINWAIALADSYLEGQLEAATAKE